MYQKSSGWTSKGQMERGLKQGSSGCVEQGKPLLTSHEAGSSADGMRETILGSLGCSSERGSHGCCACITEFQPASGTPSDCLN